jgi:hypothetical protein
LPSVARLDAQAVVPPMTTAARTVHASIETPRIDVVSTRTSAAFRPGATC